MALPLPASAFTRTAAPTWAPATFTLALAEPATDAGAQLSTNAPIVAPEASSGATFEVPGPGEGTVPPAGGSPPPLLPLHSADGRVSLTETMLTVRGQSFLLLELERAELTPVRWILWYLLGGLGLAAVMIAFLQNWLRTGPAMLGMALTALLLAYGHRGTNRLRLYRLGREMVNFALPGETPPWQQLTAEINRRIFRVHDQAAQEAAALLAAADEATRLAAQAAQGAGEAALPNSADDSLPVG
ncbi:hypothetical protein IC235_10525 [Hymenobacter sp. BT664]|uniref:Uncharacterized protein n=1 Tax=Hymenobacter montanus TaxID=2771359 RepID=A0A927BE55_9BACT|nr:hypothetical protein [Hymenobacter montanus]MBD2768328.1 hypothetical protein [Hymenobacter montanus]